jgi:hypothetical protein
VSDALTTTVIKYKIIVEVETPEGLKTGSNVVQVTITPKFVHWNPSSPPVSTRVKAEAIFIDLGQGKNIVSTLTFGESGTLDRIGELAQSVFKCTVSDLYIKMNNIRQKLTGSNIPVLITFSDQNNLSTLRVVKPDEFEQVLGNGYSFKGAWIEISENAVDINRIDQSLPWVGTYNKELIAEKLIRASGNAGASIAVGMAFRRGDNGNQ